MWYPPRCVVFNAFHFQSIVVRLLWDTRRNAFVTTVDPSPNGVGIPDRGTQEMESPPHAGDRPAPPRKQDE